MAPGGKFTAFTRSFEKYGMEGVSRIKGKRGAEEYQGLMGAGAAVILVSVNFFNAKCCRLYIPVLCCRGLSRHLILNLGVTPFARVTRAAPAPAHTHTHRASFWEDRHAPGAGADTLLLGSPLSTHPVLQLPFFRVANVYQLAINFLCPPAAPAPATTVCARAR